MKGWFYLGLDRLSNNLEIRLSFILVLFLVSINIASASLFYAPRISTFPSVGSDINISISSSSPLTNPRLYYKRINERQWSYAGILLGNATIPSSYITKQGIYEYFFNDTNGRLPEQGSFRISITNGFDNFYQKALNLTMTDSSSNAYCRPYENKSYACDLENFQAAMITSFANAYYITNNYTFLSIVHNLSTANFDTPIGEPTSALATCNPIDQDFDCENKSYGGGRYITGAKRQASMIYSLWDAYQKGANDTLRILAINYSEGSAEECDVWNSDFICSNNSDQGLMTLAYWKAYEMTGNYEETAESLTNAAFNYTDSDYLILAFWKAYELTGNSTYYDRAINLTEERIEKCRIEQCSITDQALTTNAYWKAYEMTGKYEYMRAAIDKTQSDSDSQCDIWNNSFQCNVPDEQGLISEAIWKAYQTIPNASTGFYSPRFLNRPELGEDLIVYIKLRQNISAPKLYYRKIYGTWQSISIPQNGTVVIPGSELLQVGNQEYFFNDSNNNKFPENDATLKFVAPAENLIFRNKANTLTQTDSSLYYCSPNQDSYHCRLEYMQAWSMLSFSNAYYTTRNSSYYNITNYLATGAVDNTSIIRDTNGWYATCDHENSDFGCNLSNIQFPGDDNKKPGALRQGAMIYSLWNAYQSTGNETIEQLAKSYTENSAEDCDLWAGDFNCSNDNILFSDEENQGLMTLAYWKAYEMTGDYIEIAKNLTNEAFNYNGSEYLLLAFWKAYELTGNSTYYDQASLLSNEMYDRCKEVTSSCSAEQQALNIIAYWEAYKQELYNASARQRYFTIAMSKTFAKRDDTSCDPNDIGEYECSNPNEQGMMATAFWYAYSNFKAGNESLTVDILAESNVSINETLNMTCQVDNTANSNLNDVTISLSYPSLGLNITGNDTYNFNVINVGSSILVNWTLTPLAGGPHTLECTAWTANGTSNSSTEMIIVNNLGSVFDLNLSISDEILRSENNTMEFIIKNNKSYKLYNATVELKISDKLTINDISLNNLTDAEISSDNLTIVFSQLLANESRAINWIIIGQSDGQGNISINLSSLYGGTNNISENVIIRDGPFIIRYSNFTYPNIIAGQEFNISAYIENNVTFPIYNATISLNTTGGLNVTRIFYNEILGNSTQNNFTVIFPVLAPNENKTVNWTLKAIYAGFKNISLNVTAHVGIGQNTSDEVLILREPPKLTLTVPTNKKKGEEFNITLFIENNGSNILYNLSIDINTTSGLNITGIVTNISLAIISTNNQTVNFSIINASENRTITWLLNSTGDETQQIIINASSWQGANAYVSDYIDIYSYEVGIFSNDTVSIDNTLNLSCQLNNSADSTINNISIDIIYPTAGLNVSRNEPYNFAQLNVSESITVNWTLTPLAGGPHTIKCTAWTNVSVQNSTNKEIIVNNLGSVFNLNITVATEILTLENNIVSLIIRNNVSYKLYNVSAGLNLSQNLTINGITLDNQTDTNISADNLTVMFYELLQNQTKVINWTIVGQNESRNNNIFINVSSFYDGRNNISSESIRIRNTPFTTSYINYGQTTLVAGDEFEINFFAENNFSSTIYNITINLNTTSGINITSIKFNQSIANNSNNNFTIIIPSLSTSENFTINWTLKGIISSFNNISINISAHAGIDQIVSIDENLLILNEPPALILNNPNEVKKDTNFTASLIIKNNGSNILYNVSIEMNVSEGLNINKTFLDNISRNVTNITFFFPVLNFTYNRTINWTFDATGQGGQEIIINSSSFRGASLNFSVPINNYFCGDSSCNPGESAVSCPGDCSTGSGSSPGGGGGGGISMLPSKDNESIKNITKAVKNETTNQTIELNETNTTLQIPQNETTKIKEKNPIVHNYPLYTITSLFAIALVLTLVKKKELYLFNRKIYLNIRKIWIVLRIRFFDGESKKNKKKQPKPKTKKNKDVVKYRKENPFKIMVKRIIDVATPKKVGYIRNKEIFLHDTLKLVIRALKENNFEEAENLFSEAEIVYDRIKSIKGYKRIMLAHSMIEELFDAIRKQMTSKN